MSAPDPVPRADARREPGRSSRVDQRRLPTDLPVVPRRLTGLHVEIGSLTTIATSAGPAMSDGEGASEYDAATMAVDHAPPETRRSRRASATPLEHGYLALTAALYPDGNAVSAEILEFDIASWGHDADHAYAMIVEAVEGAIAAVYHDSVVELEAFLRQEKITVHPRSPRRYRPAAIPSHLLSQPGLVLRPVSISIEAALRT